MKNISIHPSRRRTCAVVPAAGRGSRLGIDVPKVFVPILPLTTIWEVIHGTLSKAVDHIVLVLSPEGHDYLGKNREWIGLEKTEVGVQPAPLGMGDAIFGVADRWREYDDILIVWGDQFNLSLDTLKACLEIHAALSQPALTIPLVRVPQPYVQYAFDSSGKHIVVRQSREGDRCEPNGFSDVGVFLLSGGPRLSGEWGRYLACAEPGRATGEVNFLPFLSHLSSMVGWSVGRYETNDPDEAVGINTPEDLAFAQRLLRKKFPPLEKPYE